MSNRTFKRTGRVGAALAVGFAFAAVPVAAQAAPVAPVNLATASPFVVFSGLSASNRGVSVLTGNLGVTAPMTKLTGFDTAVVNGATHAGDGVANQAYDDLVTAYNNAAGQPVLTGNDLSGTDLGDRTLKAGAYKFTSSALLSGPLPLVLDGEGNPNAQFVFEIGSSLTTETVSSVVLRNGASPCNVFWQVGSSATLNGPVFEGNVMALAGIPVGAGVTVHGRLLAQTASVTLINDTIDNSMCAASTTPPTGPPTPTPTPTTPGAGTPANQAPPASRSATPTRAGTARLRRPPTSTTSRRSGPACTAGFHATVTGSKIKRVVFSLDGKRIGTKTKPAFRQFVRASAGRRHTVSARVAFKDATHSKTLKFRYRACAAQVLRPRQGPSQFTG